MTTPKDETFTLNLPAGSKDKYETAIAVIPQDMRTYWRYHRVDYGDTLPGAGPQVSHLDVVDCGGQQPYGRRSEGRNEAHHSDRAGTSRHADDGLLEASRRTTRSARAIPSLRWQMTSRCRSTSSGNGTTCTKRRTRSGTNVGHLQATESRQRRDRLGGKPSRNGPRPIPAASLSDANGSQTAKYHKVKKGETLSSIAESNHVSVADLKRDNPKLDANLQAGDVLVIRK